MKVLQNIIWINRESTGENPFTSIGVAGKKTDKQDKKLRDFITKLGQMVDKLEADLVKQKENGNNK